MENIKFVAVDLETASPTKPRHICQIGIVAVNHDHEVILEKSIYVQPPGNKHHWSTTAVHGLTPEDTADAKTFAEVWFEISHLFHISDCPVVAHNASFDYTVMIENLEYYDINSLSLHPFRCTKRIYNKGLHDLCLGFGIDYTNHHNAAFDAACCAQFYINYLDGVIPNEDLMATVEKTKKKKTTYVDYKERTLSGDVLKKDLTNADPNNPFYDKKVVITGIFDIFTRKELAAQLKSFGADIDTSLSRKTKIVLIGESPGPAKLEKIKSLQHDGYDIKIIKEDELSKILSEYPL